MEPSTTEKEPLFSFKNFFRPTSKNVTIWANSVKGLTVAVAALNSENTHVLYGCMLVGAIAELFIYFTKEEPVDTIIKAVDDIKEEQTQPIENVSN